MNPDGNSVNPDARCINPDGNSVNPDARYINPDGNSVNPDARCMNPDARCINREAIITNRYAGILTCGRRFTKQPLLLPGENKGLLFVRLFWDGWYKIRLIINGNLYQEWRIFIVGGYANQNRYWVGWDMTGLT
jgi:hypothetical protein